MTYNKETLKEAIVQKLRLNYGCTEQQATDGEMMKACAMVLRDIMAERNITVAWDESVIDHLVREAYSVTYGARNLRRTIQKQIEDEIASQIVDRHGENISYVNLSAADGKIKVEIN